MTRPTNKALWLIGADDGSTGYTALLEQDDGGFYVLFKIEPDGDATAIGMIFGATEGNRTLGYERVYFSATFPPGSGFE